MLRLACAVLALVVGVMPAVAQQARPTWTTGRKQGIGTSAERGSRVWLTLADGALTEVYYPTIDAAQLRDLELIVSDGKTFAERESEATTHTVELLDPSALLYRQVNAAKSGAYRIEKTYATTPGRDALLISITVTALAPASRLEVHVAIDPALGNSALHDAARAWGGSFTAWERDVALAVVARPPFIKAGVELAGDRQGIAALLERRAPARKKTVADGDVRGYALLGVALPDRPLRTTLSLGFGASPSGAERVARAALAIPFDEAVRSYVDGWHGLLAGRWIPADPLLGARYRVAYMTLRAHEDKTYPGAMIASLSVPWGEVVDAREPTAGGYHLVWARDLYHVATALDAAGDRAAALRALDYLFGVQQRPDGSFPQNSWLDGRPYFDSLQLDEVAFPIVLAHELGRTDALTYSHARRAAEFLVARGPSSPQERWEEESGYSPSTIAAEIAGLVCAAELARAQADPVGPVYLALADAWQRQLETWTAFGPPGKKTYLRVAQRGRPDAGDPIVINSGGGTLDERKVVDAGFLELVRLGVKRADDPTIVRSLALVDRTIRVETPVGPAFYRYNADGYGEKDDGRGWDGTGKGRLWPLLTGERGEYLLAAGKDARAMLETLASFANQGLLIPEQVWDKPAPLEQLRFGEGTGGATPLAWSMAELIRLARGVELGRVIGRPEPVARRYATPAGPPRALRLTVAAPAEGARAADGVIRIDGTTEARQVLVHLAGRTITLEVLAGKFSGEVSVTGTARVTVAAIEGARTAAVQRTVTGKADAGPVKTTF